MEGLLGIILVAVIGLISAAIKSNKKRGDTSGSAEGQPPRSVPLSDIQRAFMMTENSALPPTQAPGPVYPPSAQASARPVYPPQPPRPAYTPAQQTAYAPVQARTAAPLESRMAAPIQARTAAAVPPHPMYAAQQTAPRPDYSPPQQTSDPLCPAAASVPPLDYYGGSMGSMTTEGRGNAVMSVQPLETVRAAVESVADINLESMTDLNSPVLSVQRPQEKPAHKGMPLGLFADKKELVKAVIYAEILTPKSTGAPRA